MSQPKPYYLTVRPFDDMDFTIGGRAGYIRHSAYSKNASNYIRTYLILQNDFMDLLNYVEPSSDNLGTYSLKIQDLMIRVCIEIESNFKAILSKNNYSKSPLRMNIKDYYMIHHSHHLGNYLIKLPYWSGRAIDAVRQPFRNWWQPSDLSSPWTLDWYNSYNSIKHDKASNINHATFRNLIDAFSALTIVISAQYMSENFSSRYESLLVSSGYNDGFDDSIGGYFGVSYPRAWSEDEYYNFDWQELSKSKEPFQKYDYDALKNSLIAQGVVFEGKQQV